MRKAPSAFRFKSESGRFVSEGQHVNILVYCANRPTNESRNGLIKDIAQVMESYRRQARDVRKVAMKLVKADIDDGVVGSEEGSLQQKEVRAACNLLAPHPVLFT